jgi:peptide/nickel transport system substrate-binding protein
LTSRTSLATLCFAATLLALVVIAGCGGEAPAPGATATGNTAAGGVQTEGRLVRRLENDVTSLNPVLMSTSYERDVLAYLFDALVEVDATMRPAPGVATRWDISPDGTTFRFFLDPGASFDDGTPVTAEDVLFSVRKYAEESSQISGYLQGLDLKKTRVVDPQTVEVVFESGRSAGQIYAFGFPVIAEHVYGKGDFKKDFNDKVVGNGPYRLVSRTPGSEIVLERRDDYHGTKPPIRSVVFKVIPNETIAWSALTRGEIDEMRISAEQFSLGASDPELRKTIVFHQFYELGYNFIAWNNRFEPLSDPDIRRAFTMAIDRGAVVQHMYAGGARVMSGPFTVEQWAFNPAVPPIPYDPAASRAMLESKGWVDTDGDGVRERGKKKLRIELLVAAEDNASVQQGEIYQQALRDVGVDLVVRKMEGAAMIERVVGGKFEAVFLGYSLDLDPDLFANFHSSQFTPEGQNWVFYSNPEVDELLAKGRLELDQAKRREMYMRVHEILAHDQPYTWLVQPSTKWAVSKQIQNVQVAAGIGLFHWIPGARGWWIAPRRQQADDKGGKGN